MIFTVATYNVHDCVGTDRRSDPDRIARVIAACSSQDFAINDDSSRFVFKVQSQSFRDPCDERPLKFARPLFCDC